MAAGYAEWLAVLNQLAGTKGLGELAAANAYAGTTNMGLEAALSIKAYGKIGYEINSSCNKIAGTTGMEALHALNIKAGNAAP